MSAHRLSCWGCADASTVLGHWPTEHGSVRGQGGLPLASWPVPLEEVWEGVWVALSGTLAGAWERWGLEREGKQRLLESEVALRGWESHEDTKGRQGPCHCRWGAPPQLLPSYRSPLCGLSPRLLLSEADPHLRPLRSKSEPILPRQEVCLFWAETE